MRVIALLNVSIVVVAGVVAVADFIVEFIVRSG